MTCWRPTTMPSCSKTTTTDPESPQHRCRPPCAAGIVSGARWRREWVRRRFPFPLVANLAPRADPRPVRFPLGPDARRPRRASGRIESLSQTHRAAPIPGAFLAAIPWPVGFGRNLRAHWRRCEQSTGCGVTDVRMASTPRKSPRISAQIGWCIAKPSADCTARIACADASVRWARCRAGDWMIDGVGAYPFLHCVDANRAVAAFQRLDRCASSHCGSHAARRDVRQLRGSASRAIALP